MIFNRKNAAWIIIDISWHFIEKNIHYYVGLIDVRIFIFLRFKFMFGKVIERIDDIDSAGWLSPYGEFTPLIGYNAVKTAEALYKNIYGGECPKDVVKALMIKGYLLREVCPYGKWWVNKYLPDSEVEVPTKSQRDFISREFNENIENVDLTRISIG